MNLRAPKGTTDMLPATARAWEHLMSIAQELFARYGYEPLVTPIFEHVEVFARGIGEATDIVSKEMYTFVDRADPPNSLALRPEGTASVVRAVLQHGLVPPGGLAKVYYAGPMFRYERPQKGRMRQFWQIGVELLGADGPSADAEVIALLVRYFEAAGIPAARMRLLVNTMGDERCRPGYGARVASHIEAHTSDLCDQCLRRAVTNPLRAFDCKNQRCAEVMAAAPLISDALCETCVEHHSVVKRHLELLGIAYVDSPHLVRGLDYYTRTVFEVQVDEGLGSQNAIGGGGRYDRLMESYGGPRTPGLGFALGFERTVLALEACGARVGVVPSVDAYVARVEPALASAALLVAMSLRDAGFTVEMDHQERSLKAQFKIADRCGARVVVIVGPDEVASGQVTVRDMGTKHETRVPLTALSSAIASYVRGEGGPS